MMRRRNGKGWPSHGKLWLTRGVSVGIDGFSSRNASKLAIG